MIALPIGKAIFSGAAWRPNFLLRDDFTTAASAPLSSPRTCDPGPGTLTMTDTGPVVSVSSAMLQIGAVRAAAGDPGLWGAGLTRTSGLAVVSVVSSAVTNVVIGIGFDTNQSGSLAIGTYLSGGTEVRALSAAGGQIGNTNIYTTGVKKTAVVARAVGELCFFHNGTNWILIWVDATDAGTPLFPSITAFGAATVGAVAVDTLRALMLPAPFTDNYGIATQRLAGSRSALDTFTHTADCLIEFTDTTRPSASNLDLRFRRQDATNYWQVTIDSTGAFTLNEVVAGTPTQRGTAAAVVSSGHRIVIVADGTTIRGYSNNVLRWTYASASNFATATAGELTALGTSGVVNEVISWPRTLSNPAAAYLDQATGS